MSDAPAAAETEAVEPLLVHGRPAVETTQGTVVHTDLGGYEQLVKAFHAEGYSFCADLCGVDHLGNTSRALPQGIRPERFEIVVVLRNLTARTLVRIRAQVPAADATVPSLFGLYPGTEAMEREAYDLFGIRFAGHPDLSRILLPDEWEGHPLRKDYEQGRVPVQFKHPAGQA